ncbi:type III secretion system chaperone [Pseudomonas asuensis]|uniref:Type III chaperone ShcE n=1 Tax=Pseudomonas asuensis TaxID=1825787 RepID=A0ABQ2H5X7_9PSED|nr:type III secretion system chaperone [Pseudomonas asuensis]GGM32314.1 type III chaperone ShcE [Pseudomonas asuensis]
MNAHIQLDNLLHHFAKACKTSLRIDKGVCALYGDDQREAAVLEMPPGSTILFIHCEISTQLIANQELLNLLMKMNFEANAMRGCWLAIDEYNTLRLCTQHGIGSLNEQQFTSLLIAFIALVKDVRATLGSLIQ